MDWLLLSTAASLIKKYLKKEGKDQYASDLLKDGDCVVCEKTPDNNFPKDLEAAVDGGVFDIISGDGEFKVVLSEKTKKSYEKYNKIKEDWSRIEKELVRFLGNNFSKWLFGNQIIEVLQSDREAVKKMEEAEERELVSIKYDNNCLLIEPSAYLKERYKDQIISVE